MATGTRPLPGPLSREVARILKRAIDESSLTQEMVAIGSEMISPAQLSRALTFQKVLSLDQLDALCRVLQIDVTAVIAKADEDSAPSRPAAAALSARRRRLDEIAQNKKINRRK